VALVQTTRACALGVLAIGAIAAGTPVASAKSCQGAGAKAPNTGSPSILEGVAATSSCNAWAVGAHRRGTLIEHWNGRAWNVQRSPSPGFVSYLRGVAAASSTNAWAVGDYFRTRTSLPQTLIEHWDGRTWKVQPSPNPQGDPMTGVRYSVLFGVAATSARNAWAVGEYFNGDTDSPTALVLHWNGKSWKVQPSPNLELTQLLGVAATSPTNAWAVGQWSPLLVYTLIEHWDGRTWTIIPSPSPGPGGNQLNGVAATSTTNAWAVGSFFPTVAAGQPPQTLIERWDGSAWTIQSSPSLGTGGGTLNGVAATSASNAWAVGFTGTGHSSRTLILHWDGTAWSADTSPDPSSSGNGLLGAAAISSTNAWAVGATGIVTSNRTLILNWDGQSWLG
jgi:hypothetical protein